MRSRVSSAKRRSDRVPSPSKPGCRPFCYLYPTSIPMLVRLVSIRADIQSLCPYCGRSKGTTKPAPWRASASMRPGQTTTLRLLLKTQNGNFNPAFPPQHSIKFPQTQTHTHTDRHAQARTGTGTGSQKEHRQAQTRMDTHVHRYEYLAAPVT